MVGGGGKAPPVCARRPGHRWQADRRQREWTTRDAAATPATRLQRCWTCAFAPQRAEACACRRGHVAYNHVRFAVDTRGVFTCWIRRHSSIGHFRTLPASPAHQSLHKCGYIACIYALACSQWLSMDLLPLHGGAHSSSGDPVGRRVYLTSC